MLLREAASDPGEVAIALTALLITSGATIAVPASFKSIIDKAFGKGANADTINSSFRWLLVVVVILGLEPRCGSTSCRGWASASSPISASRCRPTCCACRRASSRRTARRKSPRRMTSDTAIIEQVVGTTCSIALRELDHRRWAGSSILFTLARR
jgi:ATP-binding cassette subfamily B protein